jgi:replicative DNA helicase
MSKTKTQKSIRLNVDEELDILLSIYESKYSLLSRADIIKMLLSEAIYNHKSQSNNVFSKLRDIHKNTKPVDEDTIFALLEKHSIR